ncbi:glycosyltransferase family 39 protein [uncultured Thiodictyon sp.]|jgi:4-amino-4-deoxy-L-arabinose transferase-like glycosyltransferase|uniref:glycosyltransferase family 39 protein n=1 Tax=uncultured Thiodictyon sp. TaxID=1846217 RepID=UPI0025DE4297|nr:glycosyltransferase family 39 protein [uncultured Thiodictyon sp.]
MGKDSAASPWPLAAGLILAMTLWHLGAAALLPVTQDEAYYFDWARSLSWGYFDHPPGVAAVGLGTRLAADSVLAARLGGLLAGTLTLVLLARLYYHSGLVRRDDLGLALVLAFATLAGLAGGLLTTPDTPLALAWALALHEGERALAGQRRRWLTAGLATGLGLLGKYNMVLIGPVFLWAILWCDPRALRTRWPWLGGLLAVLVFAPNLLWNLDHDWLTLRFQFGHGFALDPGVLVGPGAGTASAAIEPAPPASWWGRGGALLRYLGGQLGLWGLLAPALIALVVTRTGRRADPGGTGAVIAAHARPLLQAAALFPLGFFALVALGSEVEANWPAVYLLAAPALLAAPLRGLRRWVLAGAAANLLLVSLYAYHGATGALPLPDGQNRILRETHGFRDLATLIAGLDAPVYADRYQLTAMLRFYQPGLPISQWPGLTRPSEYLLGQIAPRVDPAAQTGPFWLVTRRPVPPTLPGFTNAASRTLYDCPGAPLAETAAAPCAKPLHEWHLYRFEKSPAGRFFEP